MGRLVGLVADVLGTARLVLELLAFRRTKGDRGEGTPPPPEDRGSA